MENANIDTFGFELLLYTVRDDIKKKEDVLILFAHWYLVKCGLKCVGIGDKTSKTEITSESELLPKDWNAVSNYYALRYKKDETLYLLCGIKTEDELLMNIVNWSNDSISNLTFSIEKVQALHGTIKDMIPTYATCLYQLQNDLVEPVCKLKNCKTAETQTPAKSTRQDRHDLTERTDVDRVRAGPLRTDGPQGVGVSDLYPGASGGGMLFDPFNNRPNLLGGIGIPERLPPGARPPGARFNPIGLYEFDPTSRFNRRGSNDDFFPPGSDMLL